MTSMFMNAKSFNGDISKWDVSSVSDMSRMFWAASLFNCDISKWDVSSVTGMDSMFKDASSFAQQLCEEEWVYSKASKEDMFVGSAGSIVRRLCESARSPSITNAPMFSLQSNSELKDAINACIEWTPQGRCSAGPHGPIGKWVVSRVTDMADLFSKTIFNGRIAKWDVSRVTDMTAMFAYAASFNGDISEWDV